MEFKPVIQKKQYSIKNILVVLGVFLFLLVLALEIYSPIYINNFEDLDVQSESDRVGGDFYEKDGDKMYYADYKNADAADTVIFLHGLNGSSFTWRKNISNLSAKYHIISFDLLGFGFSKVFKSTNINLDRDTEVISSFIKEKNLKNITVIGTSIGGIVAQKLAIQNPNEVISLVLINSLEKYDSANSLNNIESFPLVKNPLVMLNYKSLRSDVEKSYYDKTLIEKLTLEGYEKGFRYKGSSDALVRFAQSPKSKEENLSQIKQLTLIYSSENDEIVNKSTSEDLSKKIINSTLISIPKSGHLLMEEQPAAVSDGIDKWILEARSKLNFA